MGRCLSGGRLGLAEAAAALAPSNPRRQALPCCSGFPRTLCRRRGLLRDETKRTCSNIPRVQAPATLSCVQDPVLLIACNDAELRNRHLHVLPLGRRDVLRRMRSRRLGGARSEGCFGECRPVRRAGTRHGSLPSSAGRLHSTHIQQGPRGPPAFGRPPPRCGMGCGGPPNGPDRAFPALLASRSSRPAPQQRQAKPLSACGQPSDCSGAAGDLQSGCTA